MKKAIICSLLAAMVIFTACGKTDVQDNNDDGTLSAEVTTTTAAETTAKETEATEPEASETITEATEAPETEAPATTAKPAGSSDGKAADEFMDMLNGDTFYIKASAEAEGMTMKLTVAGDGSNGKNNMYMNMDVAGFKMVVLANEDGSYLIDEASKTYYASDETAKDDMTNGTLATKSYKKTNSGEGTVNGVKYSYCEYDFVDDDDTTGTYRVYYNGGKVAAVEVIKDDETAVMIIEEYSAAVPAGIFEIPAGYTEKDAADAFSFGG